MNTHIIVAGIRQDVSKIRADTDSQNRVVSDERAICRLIHTDPAQTQSRSVISITERPNVLYLHLVRLGNYHLHRQGFSSGATN